MKFDLLDFIDWLWLIILICLMLCIMLSCSGCTVTKWTNGNESFSRTSFGITSTAQKISVSVTPTTRTLTVTGYQNNGTESLGAVTEAAVTAAIKSARP
jgi:uncharacterized protein YceK